MIKLSPLVFVHHLILVTVLSLAGCGGGEGSPYQQAGTSPSIWNLVVSPTSAVLNQGGGVIDVDISVDFTDPDGDVDYMGTNALDSSGSLLYVGGASIPQFVGQTSGMAQASIRISTDAVGQFTLLVWLVDQTIRASNRLDVQFTIT